MLAIVCLDFSATDQDYSTKKIYLLAVIHYLRITTV